MKKKARLIGYIIGVLIFISTIVGVSYAMYRKSLYNVNISGELKNLNEYVIYSKGVNISSGTLNPVASYSSGSSATITFYQNGNAPYDIYGHIYLDINTMSPAVSRELKYTIVDNSASSIVNEGSFYTYISGNNLLAAANIPLNTTETTYTVYVWVDEELYDSGTSNSGINIDIRCYATMKTITNEHIDAVVPSTDSAANYIKYIYDSYSKSTATVNSITYNLAPSVNLMNDRHASMSVDINGGNIRYYGENADNYVWLGDTYTSKYTFNSGIHQITRNAGDKKLWRIIGVFDGRLKLVSNDPISNTNLAWDTSASTLNSGYGMNQWGESTYSDTGNEYKGADLMRLLNPGFDNNQDLNSSGNTVTVNNSLYWNKGTGTVYTGRSNATTSNVSFENTGLSVDEKNMIDTVTWYLGAPTLSYINNVYEDERGNIPGKSSCNSSSYCSVADTVIRTLTWDGKVGLVYPSDYGYATDLSLCTYQVGQYYNYVCYHNDWLWDHVRDQFTISPNRTYSIFIITTSNGYINSSQGAYYGNRIRPAVYLKSGITISGGIGTESDPYVLSLG